MVRNYFLQAKNFFEIDLWRVKISSLPKTKGILYHQLRVWIIAFQEFKKDKIVDKASALTYFTLLSFVPVIAMAFGISKGFGLDKALEKQLQEFFGANTVVYEKINEWSTNMLDTANGGIISGISFVFLMYAVVRLMYNIELAFNEVWNTKSRSWQRKIADYLAIILLGPIFIILSSGATVFVTTQVNDLAGSIDLLTYVKPAITMVLKLVPYSLIWILLFLLYIIFPNTKVKLMPALIAGILAGTAFQLTQWAWVNGQVYLSKYNTIYGVFAALPLFMIYLQISWLIVLFGAEYAFGMQNANTWEYKSMSMRLSGIHRKKVTLLILRHIIKNFELGNPPMSVSDLSKIVHIPYRFILDILRELEDVGIVNRVVSDDSEKFVPGMDIQRLDLHTVLRKLDYKGFSELKTNEDDVYQTIENLMLELDDSMKASKANKLLKDL
jgi:membrane protein